jgi:hypothetical protein
MDEHDDKCQRAAGSLDRDPLGRLDPLEERLAALRRTYCRELVREGRLDWDEFDVGPDDLAPGVATVQQGVGFPGLVGTARRGRWRPRRCCR